MTLTADHLRVITIFCWYNFGFEKPHHSQAIDLIIYDIHKYQTRNTNDFYTEAARTAYQQKPKIVMIINIFKKLLLTYILQNI